MYRMRFPCAALIHAGQPVSLVEDHAYRVKMQPAAWGGDRVVGLDQPVNADVVVMQRPLHRMRYELIKALQAQGVAVVVEIDDDFHAIHPQNMAWKSTNPLHNREMNRDWLKKSCAVADLVTVSTPSLAERYGSHGRVAILRNCVPEKYLDIDGGPFTRRHLQAFQGAPVKVGWSGSVATHPDDLQITGGGVREALDASCAEFVVVGTGVGVGDRLGLDGDPRATGWVSIPAYPEALQIMDVGVVPLALTNFNEAKSALKGLEMASVGVPFVASPTGEYKRLAKSGVGWIAESPAEWRTLVEQLARDNTHREALAEAWREQVRAEHTYEGNAMQWWDAWTWARELADGRAAA